MWNDEELLLVIALIDVEDAKKIEHSIFSDGFKTLAQVIIYLIIYETTICGVRQNIWKVHPANTVTNRLFWKR